jgi:hypothetical protein
MLDLRENIEIFERIIADHSCLDSFITSESPDEIAWRLAGGKYKLRQVGFTLALEYLRSVGVRRAQNGLAGNSRYKRRPLRIPGRGSK